MHMKIKPVLQRPTKCTYSIDGVMGEYLNNVTAQWLKIAPLANPAMLEMFRDRDRKPLRNLNSWSGEFAGKYLTAATQVLRVTGDASLKKFLEGFVADFISCQAPDGYLGCWPKGSHLTPKAPNPWGKGGHTWDAWGHYHAMIGLMLWHETTGDEAAFECVRKIADLFCKMFLTGKRRLISCGSPEMNLAPVHSLAILYRKTGEEKYLRLAKEIVKDFEADSDDEHKMYTGGDYFRLALQGKDFYQTRKPRWESLHPIMGLAELYWITGEDDYRRAFEQLWWSIVKLDRHNNGGFSSGEAAQGNPYHQGAIETCCTIAWMAMSVEMLKLTGDSRVADELELSTINSAIGFHSATGRWSTYNTPMDGVRKSNTQDIVFQSREGSPELNCCSVNAARGFGMLSDWAVMTDGKAITLNYYGPGTITAQIKSGLSVKLAQETAYPNDGRITLKVSPNKDAQFALKLRIPYWSARTTVKVNGSKVSAAAGSYCTIDRKWKAGDKVEIGLDFSLHYWAGQKECRNRVSMFRGPVLMTYDRRYNDFDPKQLPELDAKKIRLKPVKFAGVLPPIVLMETEAGGKKVRLCDFGSAGECGTPYISWLKIKNVKPSGKFSRENPLRSTRA